MVELAFFQVGVHHHLKKGAEGTKKKPELHEDRLRLIAGESPPQLTENSKEFAHKLEPRGSRSQQRDVLTTARCHKHLTNRLLLANICCAPSSITS
jgi:hypothetical protein